MIKQTQGSMVMVGAISGGVFLVAMVALMVVGAYSFSAALFLAVAAAAVVALFLVFAFHSSPKGGGAQRVTGRVPKADTATQGGTTAATTHAAATTAAPSASPPPAAEPAHPGTATEPVTPEAKEPVAPAEATVGTEPARLDQAREGGPDDLKKLKGVGPKLEEALHGMGIYHLDQVASWTESEVAWMDEHLVEFRGRVSRDDWVGQARALVSGGEADSSHRADGEVYH